MIETMTMKPQPAAAQGRRAGPTWAGTWRLALAAAWAVLLVPTAAQSAMGHSELPGLAGDGPVTVFYPTDAAEQAQPRGSLRLSWAEDAPLRPGNGRLIVISHGSGGSPGVHADQARALVEAGFIVALPRHHADNWLDDSRPGPDSWSLRPAEVSRAIDVLAATPRFAPALRLDRVGVYGLSAGGHTALSLAGGRWSPARFNQHCQAHLAEDFQACVGLATELTGGPLDGTKLWLARSVLSLKFSDATPRAHQDARVAAVVAAVPAAADFDPDSLRQPTVPLGLLTAAHDRWLHPQFHSDAVLAVCTPCVRIADLPQAGHGAYLSPLPPALGGLVGSLLNDPPGFDRGQLAQVHAKVSAFFGQHLLP